MRLLVYKGIFRKESFGGIQMRSLEFRSLLQIEHYVVLSLASRQYALSTKEVQREVIHRLAAFAKLRTNPGWPATPRFANDAAAIKEIKAAGLSAPSYNRIARALDALKVEGWVCPRVVASKKEGVGWFLTEPALVTMNKSGVKVAEPVFSKQ